VLSPARSIARSGSFPAPRCGDLVPASFTLDGHRVPNE
jgi:hypothetical protein